jgi:hypothetical protein
MELSNLSVDP